MPCSPTPRPTPSLQKLQQRNVAGVSAKSVGPGVACVSLVEETWSFVRGNGEGSGGWNVGQSSYEEGGGCFEEEQGAGDDCGGLVRGVARCQEWCRVLGAMWNANTASLLKRTREQEEPDAWRLVFVDLIENCHSRSACSLVRTGISGVGCTKVISNADHQNSSELVIERNVTDLCWLGNDVTVSRSSVILKCTNAGRELERKAMQKETLGDADSLQQNIRRPFILIQIVDSRVGQDRKLSLYDPKFYSATSKKQVGDRSGCCGTTLYSSE